MTDGGSQVFTAAIDEPTARTMAVPLPEELMSTALVFLRMKDLLEWRIVSSSTKTM